MSDREPTTEQQRRQATVIFADISGFTAMSERLDAEEVTEIMNGCFRMLERIVREHGGTVDKFIGDCVMALFGAAHALEDSAVHAVRASIEMRSALERFNVDQHLPVPLQVHIGVNTGMVIAGEVGGDVKRDFTVMGDTVNLAARLEDASQKGQIFVGPETYNHSRRHIEYRKLTPLGLKGKSEPVQAYEVLGLLDRAHGPKLGGGTRQVSALLVGRAKELAELEHCVERLLHGDGQIVSLSGEAGIGKSRVLLEFSASPLLVHARVLIGSFQSVNARGSYHAFAEMLEDWAGIKEDDSESVAFQTLAGAIDTLMPDRLEETLPFVAVLMGISPQGRHAERLAGIEGEALEKLIHKAMSDLLSALASERPLVLAFEDLHWADLSTVLLLESLLRLVVEKPILFLQSFRPGYERTSDRLAMAAERGFALRARRIVLEPLSERQAQTLARGLLRAEDLPPVVRDLIVQKTEGNPFFIEEVIRALIDQGAIEVVDGGLRANERIESLQVPGTVQEVILVRVEQLDRDARRVLEIGSVIGRSFRHRLVEALSPPGVELETALLSLKERQLIHERQVRTTSSVSRLSFQAERDYVFHHALIQETVYDSLLHRRRRMLHLEVGEAIESAFPDRLPDFYGMLALHYTRGEKLDKAESYLVKAGEEATRSAASSEALGYFREAYRIYPLVHADGGEPAKRAYIEKSLAAALLRTGNVGESVPYFDRALEFLGEKRAYRTKAQAYRRLTIDLVRIFARVYLLRGRMSRRASTPEERERLAMLFERARAQSIHDPERFLFDQMRMTGLVTRVDPRTVDEAFALYAGASLLFAYSGLSFRISRRFGSVARSLLREDRLDDLFTYHLMNFMCDYFEGRWSEPCPIDDALIDRLLRAGRLWDVGTFFDMDFMQRLDQGDFVGARDRQALLRRLIDEYGYRFAQTGYDCTVALLALAERRLDEAVEAADTYVDHGIDMLSLNGLGIKAKAQVLKGDLESARSTLERGERLLGRIGRTTPYHSAEFRVASLLAAVAELEEAAAGGARDKPATLIRHAARESQKALRTAARMARIRTEAYRSTGTLAWLRGRYRRAFRWWRRSIAEGQRLGARPELARTYAEVARRLSGSATPTDGWNLDPAACSAAAAELLSEMGLIEELNQLAPRTTTGAADSLCGAS